MKKLTIVAAALAALASAGMAVAHGIDGAQSVAAVNASFSAAPAAGSVNTRTCTTSTGKTIASTKATYTGTATGSADLTGPVTLAAQSTIDTTDDIGVVNGTVRIGKTEAHFTAVYDHGTIAGTASGHGATPRVQLLGNVSAGFTTAGGFTSGKIGGGTSGGSAVELTPGACAPAKPTPPQERESSSAEGAVSAVSSTSITVAGLTCTVPASLAAKVTALHVGDRAEIRCALGALVRLEAKTRH